MDAAEKSRDFVLIDEITRRIESHEAKLQTDIPDDFVKEVLLVTKNPKVVDMGGRDSTQGALSNIIKQAKREGYDSVIFRNISDHPENVNIKTNQTIVFDENQIKTKSQLTDIWNKANK